MALSKITIVLEWENRNLFRMTEKADSAPGDIQIVKVEENSRLAEVWGSVQSLCMTFFNGKLTEIGDEMKKP